MSGGKFTIFNPRLTDYDFELNYDNLEGVNTENNTYKDVKNKEMKFVKSFRADTLLQEIQTRFKKSETKKIVQNIYSLTHDINYSLSGDYARNKWIGTYHNVKEDISKLNTLNVNPDNFMVNKKEISGLYSTRTVEFTINKNDINVYEIKNVNCIECIKDILEIENIPKNHEKTLNIMADILSGLRNNNKEVTNKKIEEFKSIKI